MEDSPDDQDIIGRVFRALHTIKGSGAMFGFDEVSAFAHEIETVFDNVREGRIHVSKELINLSLAARDMIKLLLDSTITGESADVSEVVDIITSLKQFLPAGESVFEIKKSGKDYSKIDVDLNKSEQAIKIFRIRFKPTSNIFKRGTNPVLLLNELQNIGYCRIVANAGGIPPLNEMEPELCYISWDIIIVSTCIINDIEDVFIFVEEESEIKIEQVERKDLTNLEKKWLKESELDEKSDKQMQSGKWEEMTYKIKTTFSIPRLNIWLELQKGNQAGFVKDK